MLKILREYVEGDIQVTEYTRDGVTVGPVTKTPIPVETEPVEPTEPAETLEQKIERLERQRQEDNLMQLEVMASIYEEILNKGV